MFFNPSIESAPQLKDSCPSHVSVYYEQKHLEENYFVLRSRNSSASEPKLLPNPPVEIHEECLINIDLPPLRWHGYHHVPRLLTATNTGRTILISGQWANRPYIEGGPLNGNYLFSQIHFHCPSEHEIDGKRYPLEMHVVHYKTSYLTQERAMNERDGTVVLVYLFKLTESFSTPLSKITRVAPEIEKVNDRTEIEILLNDIIKPFASNYYVYWGSLNTKKRCYLLQWIVNAKILTVSEREVDILTSIITCAGLCSAWQTSRLQPEDNAVFRVGEPEVCMVNTSCSKSCVCKKSDVYSQTCDCASSGSSKKKKCDCKAKKGSSGECNGQRGDEHVCTCGSAPEPKAKKKKEKKEDKKNAKNPKIRCELKLSKGDCEPVLVCESESEGDKSDKKKKSDGKKKSKSKKKKSGNDTDSCASDAESVKTASKSTITCDDRPKPTIVICDENNKPSILVCDEKPASPCDEKPKSPCDEKPKSPCDDNKNKKPSILVCDDKNKPSVLVCDDKNKPSILVCDEKPKPSISFCDEKPKSGKKSKHDDKKGCDKRRAPQPPYKNSGADCNPDPPCPKPFDEDKCGTKDKKKKKRKKEVTVVVDNDGKCEAPTRLVCQATQVYNVEVESSALFSSRSSIYDEDKLETSDSNNSCCSDKTTATERTRSGPSEMEMTEDAYEEVTKKRDKCEGFDGEVPSNFKKKPKNFKSFGKESSLKKGGLNRIDSENEEESGDSKTESLYEDSQSKNGYCPECGLPQNVQEVKSPNGEETSEICQCDMRLHGEKKTSYTELTASKSYKKVTINRPGEESPKAATQSSGQNSPMECEDEITTLFEKKHSRKKDKNNIKINYLMTPVTNRRSNTSCHLVSSEVDVKEDRKPAKEPEQKNFFNQNYTVNPVTIQRAGFPEDLKQRSQVCLLMEHLFRTENKEGQVFNCTSQEYHVAIVYDRAVLQEYRGKFHPQNLRRGYYQQLPLVPTYPEPENSNIRLQDCVVAKENSDEICIQVKFLVSEINLDNKEIKPEEPPPKSKCLLDEETQFNYKEHALCKDSNSKNSKSKSKTSNLSGKKSVSYGKVELLSTDIGTTTPSEWSGSAPGERCEEEDKIIKIIPPGPEKNTINTQKYKIKIQKNPNAPDRDILECSGPKDDLSELDMEDNENEKCEKKLKNLFVKRKKTVYFMYDKVERDEASGKKIFVGSFRTKEEMDNLRNQKKLQESEYSNKKEASTPKYFATPASRRVDVEEPKACESPKGRESPTKKESFIFCKDTSCNEDKDLVTLHRYKPKYSELNRFKKECKNVVIGRVVNDLQRDNENLKHLTDIIGVEKEKNPRVAIYELQESSGPMRQQANAISGSRDTERRTKARKVDIHKNQFLCTSPEKTNEADLASVVEKPHKSTKEESQAALILIPVEVESLSKIEVVLIEHGNNPKKKRKEKEPSPSDSFNS